MGERERRERKKHLKYLLINSILSVVFISLFVLEIYMIVKSNMTTNDSVFIAVSITFFVIPFISLFIPKQTHRFIYKLGYKLFKNSDLDIKSDVDSYIHYDPICTGLLVFGNLFIIIGLLIKIFN